MRNIILEVSDSFYKHRYEEAIEKVDYIKSRCILNEKTKNELARMMYKKAKELTKFKGSKKNMISLLEKSLELKSNLYESLELLGDTYYSDAQKFRDEDNKIEHFQLAVLEYKSAASISKSLSESSKATPKLKKDYGRILEKLAKAKFELSKYVPEKKPNKPRKVVIKDKDNALNAVEIYIMRGRYELARELLNAIKDDSDNRKEQLIRLKFDFVTGNFTSAEYRIEELLNTELVESDISLAIQLAKLCERCERYDVAFYILSRYNEKFPRDLEIIKELVLFYIITKEYRYSFSLLKRYSHNFNNNREYVEFYRQANYYLLTVLEYEHDLPSTYYENQIQSGRYSSEKCIENMINCNALKTDPATLKPVFRVSKKDFNGIYNKVLQEIAHSIPDEKGLTDIYTVDIGRIIGKDGGVETSKVKVSTISNTKLILDIEPTGRECVVSNKVKEKKMS